MENIDTEEKNETKLCNNIDFVQKYKICKTTTRNITFIRPELVILENIKYQ